MGLFFKTDNRHPNGCPYANLSFAELFEKYYDDCLTKGSFRRSSNRLKSGEIAKQQAWAIFSFGSFSLDKQRK